MFALLHAGWARNRAERGFVHFVQWIEGECSGLCVRGHCEAFGREKSQSLSRLAIVGCVCVLAYDVICARIAIHSNDG